MANSVNGVAAITIDAQRAITGLTVNYIDGAFRGDTWGEGHIYEARVSLDTAAAFAIDDPTVDNSDALGAGQRIFVVGITPGIANASQTLTFDSKVGAAAAVTKAVYSAGITQQPIGQVLFSTDPGGVLRVTPSSATAVTFTVFYVIARHLPVRIGFGGR